MSDGAQSKAFEPLKIAVLTVSDSRSIADDRSGDALQAGQTVRAIRHDGFTIEVEAADHPLDTPPGPVDTR